MLLKHFRSLHVWKQILFVMMFRHILYVFGLQDFLKNVLGTFSQFMHLETKLFAVQACSHRGAF